MGCASSNPVLETGKNLVVTAKETVNDAVVKGEHTLQEAGDAAKEGMEHVKEAIESAMTTAENSIGNMVGKVSNTFSTAKSEATDGVQTLGNHVEDMASRTVDGVTEVVSDTETVLASEAESARETLSTTATKTFKKIDSLTDEFGETITESKDGLNGSMHIEDIEQSIDTIDSNYKDVKKKAEDLVNGLSTPSPPPDVEDKKEEPAPTLWEAAADAILEQKAGPSIDIPDDFEIKPHIGSESETHQFNSTASDTHDQISETFENDYDDSLHQEFDGTDFQREFFEKPDEKDRMHPPQIMISSENLSIKSYKSEI